MSLHSLTRARSHAGRIRAPECHFRAGRNTPAEHAEPCAVHQVMFVLAALYYAGGGSIRRAPAGSLAGGLSERGTAKGDLLLYMARTPGDFAPPSNTTATFFEDARIERMAGHLQVLLEPCRRPPSSVSPRSPLLTPTERNLLLRRWNSATTDYRETPASTAVLPPGRPSGRRRYRRLLRRQPSPTGSSTPAPAGSPGTSSRSASAPRSSWACASKRSSDLIIQHARHPQGGGAYLPLGRPIPPSASRSCSRTARVNLLLVHDAKLQQLPPFSGPVASASTRGPGRPRARHSDLPLTSPPAPTTSPTSSASGSTGRPKGSAIIHRGIAALLFHTNFVRASPTDRVAQACLLRPSVRSGERC